MFLTVFSDDLFCDVKEALPVIKSWGSGYVDLRGMVNGKGIEYQSNGELKDLKKTLDDLGLRVGVIESSIGKVNLPDAEQQKKEKEKLEGLIRAAGVLDCSRVRAFNYWQHNHEDAEWGTLAARPDVLNNVMNLFFPIVRRAQEAGLEFSFENCGQTVEEVIALLKGLRIPGWGLTFDPYLDICWRKTESPEIYEKALEYANIVHVKTASVLADEDIPEKIILPWDQILKGISAVGRDMAVSIEMHTPIGGKLSYEEITRKSFLKIKQLWPSAAPASVSEALKPAVQFEREYKNDPVRFVVVGTGMGRNRAREICRTRGCKLYGIVDINGEKARAAGEEFGVPYSSDITVFLKDPAVEVMYVVVPTGLHMAVSEQCLRAGKHVLTTKPLESTAANARHLINYAKEQGKLLGVDFDLRQSEELLSLKKAIDMGYFGHILSVNSTLYAKRTQEYYDENGAWRGTWALDGGGAMCNQGVHEVDRLQFLLGMPKRVRANIGTHAHAIEAEDIGYAEWDYGNNMTVRYYSTTNHPLTFWYIRLELHGSAGAYVFSSGGPEGTATFYGKDARWTPEPPYPVERKFQQGSDAFAYALRTGTPLLIPGEEGLNSRLLLDAMYESGRNGSVWVRL